MDAIRDLIDRHCRVTGQVTPVAGLRLYRAEAPSPQVSTLYRPTLCLVAQGRKQVVLGDSLYEFDPSKYLIVTVDLPVTGCVVEASQPRPYLGLSLDLDPGRVAELLLDNAPPSPDSQGAIAVTSLGPDLLDPMTRLLRLLDHPDDVPVLAPLIEREIHYRLLQGGQGALLRQAATAGSHLSRIGQAADWIRLHYAEPASIEALAEQAGMSVTSFHRHFKAITTMTPFQYRTRIRLQEARRLMIVDGQTAGAIGFDVGYESQSQFSREYRRMFGAPPAADAARLRRAEAPPQHAPAA